MVLAAALGPAAGPATAHGCAVSTDAAVGEPLAINLGVPAEQSSVVGVDVTLPDGFRLDEADPGEGWVTRQEGRRLRFSGGTVPPFACAHFTLWGEVTRRGKLAFPLTTRHEDGTTSDYDGDKIGEHFGAQLVFAGVEPEPSDYVQEGGGRARRLAVVAVGSLAAAAVFAFRRRRPG